MSEIGPPTWARAKVRCVSTPRRLPIAEVLALLAAAGVAWKLWPRGTDDPPPELRCGEAGAELDCFVKIPGGSFLMGVQATDPDAPGYDPDADVVEGPPHRVDLTPYWILRTEVTVGAYRRCVAAGACSEDEVTATGGFSTYYPATAERDAQRDQYPVNSVTWTGARAFCAWWGARLPTEAEWEFAARGTDGRRWPWGAEQRCAVPPADDGFVRLRSGPITECAQDGPARADALPDPSPYGLLGMAGNVWEWTLDGYAPDAYAAHSRRDPVAPDAPTRAQRGGSWTATSPLELRTTVRGGLEPEAKLNDVGFRCVFGGGRP